jgi:hypothetical protein
MEKTIRKHGSFQNAHMADVGSYRSLLPSQRMNIILEQIRSNYFKNNEAHQRLERVYRIVKLAKS